MGLLLLMAATSFSAFAQEKRSDEEIDMLLDDLFFSEEQLIDDILMSLNQDPFIYTSITFNSNSYFSGRDSGIDQFNLYPQVSYYHPSGFSFSLTGLFYEKFDPSWDFTSVSAGYYHTIDKKENLYFNLGYAHYFYSDGSDIFTNSADLSIGLRSGNRKLGTSITASYLFGTDEALQLVSSTYGRITLVKGKSASLKFNPRLNFTIAKQTIALEDLNSQTEVQFINYNVFGLLNTQLNLPLSLVSKSWNLDIGYNINFPTPVATETNLKNTSYFNISLGYLIDLKK